MGPAFKGFPWRDAFNNQRKTDQYMSDEIQPLASNDPEANAATNIHDFDPSKGLTDIQAALFRNPHIPATPALAAQAEHHRQRDVGMLEALDAAFGRQNTVVSAWRSESIRAMATDPNPTPIDAQEVQTRVNAIPGLKQYADKFLGVKTEGQFNALKNDIERQERDKATLEQLSLPARLGAEGVALLVDLPTLIPVWRAGQIVSKSAKGVVGTGLGKTATEMAVFGGVDAAVREAFLHPTQQTRTFEESAYNVGGSIVLASLLGTASVAAINSKAFGAMSEKVQGYFAKDITDVMDKYTNEIVSTARANHDQFLMSLAEAGEKGMTATGELKGKWRERYAKSRAELDEALGREATMTEVQMASSMGVGTFRLKMNELFGGLGMGTKMEHPVLSALNSVSAVWRDTLIKIADMPFMLQGQAAGKALATSAEIEVAQSLGKYHQAKVDLQKQWAQAKKSGTYTEDAATFYAEVRDALSKGNVSSNGNDAVTAATQYIRNNVLEPFTKRLVDVGAITPEVAANPKYATTHFPRYYDVPAIMQNKDKFIALGEKRWAEQLTREAVEAVGANATSEGATLTTQKLAGIAKKAKRLARDTYTNITNTGLEVADHRNPLMGQRKAASAVEDLSEGAAEKLRGDVGFRTVHDRVFPVHDDELLAHGFLDNSLWGSLDRYTRSTAVDVALGSRFKNAAGKADPGMENSVIPALKAEYERLIKLEPDVNVQAQLAKEARQAQSHVRQLRDAMRGADRLDRATWSDAGVSVVNNFNFARMMGEVVLASTVDVGMVALRNGPIRMIQALGGNISMLPKQIMATVNKSRNEHWFAEEARRMGAAAEWVTAHRVASSLDFQNPLVAKPGLSWGEAAAQLAPGSGATTGEAVKGLVLPTDATAVVRTMQKLAEFSGHAVGLTAWTDLAKRTGTMATGDRILSYGERGWAALSKAEQRDAAELGLNADLLKRFAAEHADQDLGHQFGLKVARPSQWADELAVTAFEQAMIRDSRFSVLQPGIADRPYGFSQSPIARAMFQFMAFPMTAFNRLTTHAAQRVSGDGFIGQDAFRVYGATMLLLAMGANAEMMKVLNSGRSLEDADFNWDNKGNVFYKALDRASFTGAFGRVFDPMDKVLGIGPQSLLGHAFDDERMSKKQRTYSMKDVIADATGPIGRAGTDLLSLGSMLAKGAGTRDGKISYGEVHSARSLVPLQNHLLFRHLAFDPVERSLLDHMNVKPPKWMN